MATKILIVDDSAMVRKQVSNALVGAGFIVVEAVDGKDAHEKLKTTPDTGLIVCDVTMPHMNGIEFLEAIRQESCFDTVPVVMLTTEGRPDMIQRANSLGAKGWLVKPFKPDLLVSAVQRLTRAA